VVTVGRFRIARTPWEFVVESRVIDCYESRVKAVVIVGMPWESQDQTGVESVRRAVVLNWERWSIMTIVGTQWESRIELGVINKRKNRRNVGGVARMQWELYGRYGSRAIEPRVMDCLRVVVTRWKS
jgi:hypothetical protein